jgi:hypothetical protein
LPLTQPAYKFASRESIVIDEIAAGRVTHTKDDDDDEKEEDDDELAEGKSLLETAKIRTVLSRDDEMIKN